MIVRFLVNAAALGLATLLLPGITLAGGQTVDKVVGLGLVAVVFGLVNSLVKPLFNFVITPWKLALLGLALWVVNAVLLLVTSWVCGLLGVAWQVDGFGSALPGALLVAVVSFILNSLIGRKQKVHQ